MQGGGSQAAGAAQAEGDGAAAGTQSRRPIVRRNNRQILGQDTAGSSAPGAGTNRQVYVAPQESQSAPAPQAEQSVQPAYVQVQQTAGMQRPAAQSSPAQAASQGKRAPQTEGVVRNIQESKDASSGLERWMRAFMTGTPFPMSDEMMEFQVFSGWNSGVNAASGYSADKVIVYGNINSGKPVQDNSVRVYGVRGKGNEIIATDIENTTDGTYAQFKPEPLPAMMVKIITFVVLGVLAILVFGVISMMSGGGSFSLGISGEVISERLARLLLLAGGAMAVIFFFQGSWGIIRTGGVNLVPIWLGC